jgi:hypothetical protein
MITIQQIHTRLNLVTDVDDEIYWHINHGAVYQVYRNGNIAGIVWLSLMPEGVVMLSYRMDAKALGKDMMRATRFVIEWLKLHYSTILGTVDAENAKGIKYAEHSGFVCIRKITVENGREKFLFML